MRPKSLSLSEALLSALTGITTLSISSTRVNGAKTPEERSCASSPALNGDLASKSWPSGGTGDGDQKTTPLSSIQVRPSRATCVPRCQPNLKLSTAPVSLWSWCNSIDTEQATKELKRFSPVDSILNVQDYATSKTGSSNKHVNGFYRMSSCATSS